MIPMVEKLRSSLKDITYELIFVDDGSTDTSLQKLKSIAAPDLKIIEFRRNYGQSAALAAGIDFASAEWIVTMDGDLQNDPGDVLRMLNLAEEKIWICWQEFVKTVRMVSSCEKSPANWPMG